MPKRQKSFRISDEVLDKIHSATAETGCSEGEIIEKCVTESIAAVIVGETRIKDLLQNPKRIDRLLTLIEALRGSKKKGQ